ncbi:MAG: CPBP family intramembrane metalloprotease [Acidobacteria bacterium]|nr:CPBP family intramembrane metalloprotease [Acidobacteriota bacterium]
MGYACAVNNAEHSPEPSALNHRIVAILEVLLCSDFPTQLAIGSTFSAFGYTPFASPGQLRVGYVVWLSLADSAALIGLVLLFLHAHGERPRDVLLGRKPIAREFAIGVPLILVALALGGSVLLAVRHFAPSLRTVEHNPLQELLRSPPDAWRFAFVVLVAGGVREEIQRAFLLHRFDVWLGGGRAGVVVTSVAFGAGHLLQGADAAVVTGLLGAFWGTIYLRRRSCVAPLVSHAGFDLMQIVQYMIKV